MCQCLLQDANTDTAQSCRCAPLHPQQQQLEKKQTDPTRSEEGDGEDGRREGGGRERNAGAQHGRSKGTARARQGHSTRTSEMARGAFQRAFSVPRTNHLSPVRIAGVSVSASRHGQGGDTHPDSVGMSAANVLWVFGKVIRNSISKVKTRFGHTCNLTAKKTFSLRGETSFSLKRSSGGAGASASCRHGCQH